MDKKLLRSPLVYMGSKGRYYSRIIENLPKDINGKALDIFGGSGDVGVLMLPHKDVTINDLSSPVVDLHKMFVEYQNTPELLVKTIDDVLKLYDLSDFNKEKVDYLKSQYFKLRSDYNTNPTPEKLYALHCTSNSNMLRFSKNGMNVPYGKRKFNKELKAKLINWLDILCKREGELTFTNQDFRDIDFNDFDFIYSDSPYLNTTSGYQSTKKLEWSVREEYSLYNKLASYKGKWMLSNQLYSKGKHNYILQEFIDQQSSLDNNNIRVVELSSQSYKNCNYQREDKKTVELLIMNY